MRIDHDEYRWRPWFAWRTVTANTDGLKNNSATVWLEWVYRAKRFGFDGAGIWSTYTYLTPDKYDLGDWNHSCYKEAIDKVPTVKLQREKEKR